MASKLLLALACFLLKSAAARPEDKQAGAPNHLRQTPPSTRALATPPRLPAGRDSKFDRLSMDDILEHYMPDPHAKEEMRRRLQGLTKKMEKLESDLSQERSRPNSREVSAQPLGPQSP